MSCFGRMGLLMISIMNKFVFSFFVCNLNKHNTFNIICFCRLILNTAGSGWALPGLIHIVTHIVNIVSCSAMLWIVIVVYVRECVCVCVVVISITFNYPAIETFYYRHCEMCKC